MPVQSDPSLIRRARTANGAELDNLLYTRAEEVLADLLDNPALREPHLLILLSRRDLPRGIVSAIARNAQWMRSYAMKAAVVKHPQTPRHLALPLLRHIYLFDLMAIATTAGVAADLKRLAEDAILAQREGIALGQRLTLARRGSRRIAAALLLDSQRQVIHAALQNPAMTDTALAQVLGTEKVHPALTSAVGENQRWMARRAVKLALLRSRHLSLARFAALLPELTLTEMTDLQQDPRLSPNLRSYVFELTKARRTRKKPRLRATK